MIFLMCPQGGNLTEAPLVLCRICSQWRKIALDTPQLWCNPRCVIRLGHFDHAIAGFATWLERSGRLRPLNLSFHLKYCSPHADGHIELFEVAKSVSSRWKSLTICLSDSSSAFGLIDQLDTTNLPQLETLTMLNWWNSFSDRPYTPPANPLFSAAPALRALTIQGISPTLVPQHVFVRNLTKLRMMNYCYQDTPGRYLQLLEECSNLTYCAILCSLGPYSSNFLPRPRTLPKLIHLQIEGYCPYFSFVRILLNALTIPHLEFVSINFQFNEIYLPHGAIYIPTLADHPRDAFLNFIERSAHTLSLVPRAVDPYCFEMAASASPTRKISRSNREWLDSGFPPFSHPFRRPH